jgi:predicted  nucleic acid-binding Zn-ribbon protein
MKKVLEILIKLQEELNEERRLRKQVESVPHRIETMMEQLNAFENALKAAEENHKSATGQRMKLELELKTMESKKAKFQDQLMTVKDNVQYKAALNEISFLGSEIGATEEKILVLMDEEDKLSNTKKSAQKELAENKSKIDKEQLDLNEQKMNWEAELIKIHGNQDELRKQVESDLLAKFDMLSSKKEGIGIAGISHSGICGGCRYKIRPQVLADVISDEEIQHCDNCGRILYCIPPEVEAEENKKH